MHTQYLWCNVISTDFPMKSPVFFFAATVHYAGDVFHLNDFRFAPPYPQDTDRFGQFPTPGPEGPDFSRGLPGGGMATGGIERCISRVATLERV